MESFKIITEFDGAAPFSKEGVSKKDDGTFEVRPSWRPEPGISEEALGCGSRFSIRVENSSNQNQLFRCRINWQDKVQKRLHFHDYVMVLFPYANEWETHPCILNHSSASLEIMLPPGITHIGTSPWYGYQRAVEYLESKKDCPEVKYFSAGKSEESRDIPVLVIGSGEQDVLIMARNHAYESSGSFCIEGMIDDVLINAAEYKNKYRFHFMSMTNPDGVFNGMSRLTAPNGADLNRCIEQDDSAWRTIKAYVDKIKPSYLLNIHNWMDKEEDGILANTERMAHKFEQQMPDVTEDGHFWKLEWLELYLENFNLIECPPDCESWKDYVKKKFKATALTLEYPWYNRTTERMRQIGKQSLIAFLNSGDDFSKANGPLSEL